MTGTGTYCQYFHFHNWNVATNVWKNNLALWTKRNQENISPRCWLGDTQRESVRKYGLHIFAEKYFKQLMWFALPVALLEPALIKNTNYEVGRKMQPINQDDV